MECHVVHTVYLKQIETGKLEIYLSSLPATVMM